MSLSAKNEKIIYYSPEITDKFGKTNKFHCIGCNGEMIFHRNLAGIKIQHFVHKVTCPFETEPETKEHLEMKKWCYINISATKKYKPDSIMVGNQKPDVLLEISDKQVAIECQCSKISFEQFENRTQNYTNKGIYVLWLLGKKYFPEGCFYKSASKRVSVVEKELHYLNYGQIYHLHQDEDDEDEEFYIFPVHFESIYRPSPCDNCWWEENVNDWDGCDDRCWVYEKGLQDLPGKELKSTKKLNLGYPIENYNLCLIENKYKLARFYDKKWWD